MPNTTACPHIPAKVFLHIFKHLSANADLCSASLTCKAVREEAQRVLFHNPVPRTAYRHLLFINAILSSPSRLGPMVKVFVHVSGSAYCEGEDEGLIEKTGKVLRAMCSLKRLAFQNARRLPASVLLGTTFQLEAFNWGSAHDNTVILKEFLPTQKSLKHLTFHCNETLATPENVEIAAGMCPELRSLTGGRGAVKLFIKGKEKVTHLQYMPDSAQAQESWFPALEVQVELERLRFLKFRPCDGRFNQLRRLVDMLHSLVLLELTRQPCEPDYNHLQAMLPNIPSLRALILINFVSSLQLLANSRYPTHVARDMLAWCPHLEYIDVAILAAGEDQHFRRFYQVDTEDAEVSDSVVDPDIVFAWRRESRFDGVVDKIEAARAVIPVFSPYPGALRSTGSTVGNVREDSHPPVTSSLQM